jgi:hypothetical protein
MEGDLLPMGWGADLGYPGFRPRVGGDALAVQVLSAPLLASAWPDLDRFEGLGYERILVPVFGTELGPGQAGKRLLHTVANLYSPTEAQRGNSEVSQDSWAGLTLFTQPRRRVFSEVRAPTRLT